MWQQLRSRSRAAPSRLSMHEGMERKDDGHLRPCDLDLTPHGHRIVDILSLSRLMEARMRCTVCPPKSKGALELEWWGVGARWNRVSPFSCSNALDVT